MSDSEPSMAVDDNPPKDESAPVTKSVDEPVENGNSQNDDEPMDTSEPKNPDQNGINGDASVSDVSKTEVKEENGEAPVEDEEHASSVNDEEEIEGEEEEIEEDKKSEVKAKVITHISPKVLYQEAMFAELCSFFNTFGSAIGLKYSIEQLEKLLCTHINGKVDPELVELHLFLMRRVRINWARADKFDLCLERYCEMSPALDGEELELKRFDYVDLPMNAKLTILKALCEAQFDFNYKFKETIFHTFQSSELRLAPIGYDKNGCAFYYQQDFELSLRVYSFELDDQSGASWTLRARSSKELYKLIQDLKSADYGAKKESDSEGEELDETKIVEGTVKQELMQEESKDGHETNDLTIEMSDADKQKIQLTTKKCTLWDMFNAEDKLNKKQKQKEEKRKNREAEKAEPQKPKKVEEIEVDDAKSDKSEEKQEVADEEEEDLSEFMEDRRILPRRSARNAAISNLKQFTSQTKKRTPAEPKKTNDSNEKQESEAEGSGEESEVFDESEEEEDELDVSDDEFVGPRSRKGRGKKRKSGAKPKKPKQTSLIPRKRAPKPVAFDEESSSDEDAEEVKQKERKKANEKTLCMKCRKSNRADVLLLCDMCDDAWHIFCLRPVLHFVPADDWFCPKCHHQMLIQKLSFAFIQHHDQLKIKEEEERKKALAMERLMREQKHHGIDLKNIISNQANIQYESPEQASSEEEIDDGQRKSKRRALKKVLKRSYREHHHPRDFYTGPIVTIAEGRTRRSQRKVDYNFHAYDEQFQEAIDAIDSPPAQGTHERPSGLGRGKDMATILKAEERRGSLEEEEVKSGEEEENVEQEVGPSNEAENTGEVKKVPSQQQRKHGRPPVKKKTKKAKRLTDLDLDNATESETDEYHATSDEQAEEEEEPTSEDEYVPSDVERRRSGRNANRRTRSDDEFINDDDSDSDFEPGRRKGKAPANRKRKGGKSRGSRKAKRGRKWSDSEEETEEESDEEYQENASSEDDKPRRRIGQKPTKSPAKPAARKWGPKVSSDEEEESEEVEMDEEESDNEGPITQAGRPLRRAATEMKKKIDELEKQGSEIDHEIEEEEGDEPKAETDLTKIIGKPRRAAKIQDEDEEDFEPDQEENNTSEESADEQIEEEIAQELLEKKQRHKRQIHSDDDEEEKIEEPKTISKPTVKVTPQRSAASRPSPQKQTSIENGTSASKPGIKRQETQESQRASTPEDPTPPVKRGGRRKSDAPPAPKSPRKPRNAQITPKNTPSTSTVQTTKVASLPRSNAQPIQQLEQMRPLAHHTVGHPQPMTSNVTYIAPPQSVAYALPPHIRPMPVQYVQQAPPHMQPGYEYYGAPPPQYLHGHPPPPTTHVYHPPPAHLIGGPPNSYQVYSVPYEHGGEQQVTQLQTMRPVDPDSLGHALAGAMNPENL